MKSTDNTALINTFAALRFATGAAAWLAPSATGRRMGLSSGHDQPFTAQLFGSRELTLALAISEPVSPQMRTFALQLGLLTDALTSSPRHAGSVPAPCHALEHSLPAVAQHCSRASVSRQ